VVTGVVAVVVVVVDVVVTVAPVVDGGGAVAHPAITQSAISADARRTPKVAVNFISPLPSAFFGLE
jgi:hypothetical protein